MKSLTKIFLIGTIFLVTLIPLFLVLIKSANASSIAVSLEFLYEEEVFKSALNSGLNKFGGEQNDCGGDKDDEC